MFFEIGVLKNFSNFTGKHVLESLFNKVQGPLACNFIKERLQQRCFSARLAKFLKRTFFKEHLGWLLLYILYPHDVTCSLSRWNNGYNGIYKKDQQKLKHFEKIVFWNKFYIIFHFLSLCAFISIQNIGRSVPLKCWIFHKRFPD